jgi:phenylpropionate dioxygenase-like ring-hydroxylating dioxygenase large terminal subunit
MGALMREYWMPALKSSELERDGPPTRFMLLGERLIAFRDSDGRIGVMDHRCPAPLRLALPRAQRGGRAALPLSRLEVRHVGPVHRHAERAAAAGFQAQGEGQGLRSLERAGLVWVYMGARADAPPLPALQILDAPTPRSTSA